MGSVFWWVGQVGTVGVAGGMCPFLLQFRTLFNFFKCIYKENGLRNDLCLLVPFLTIIRLYTFFMYLTVAENKTLRLCVFYEGGLYKCPLVGFRMLVEGVTSIGVG